MANGSLAPATDPSFAENILAENRLNGQPFGTGQGKMQKQGQSFAFDGADKGGGSKTREEVSGKF